MTVNCNSLDGLNDGWLEEDLGSIFHIYNVDDLVTGIEIALYLSISLLILNLIYYCRRKGIKRVLSLSIKHDTLELTTTKSPESTKTAENIKNKVVNKKKQSINHDPIFFGNTMYNMVQLIGIYICIATLFIILYIPGYFIGAHIQDSYDSYVEVGCILFNCAQNRKYDGDVMYQDYNISSCYNCLDNDGFGYGDGCFLWKFDMDALCTAPNADIILPDTSYVNRQFYGTFVSPEFYNDLNHNQKCFINKNTFKVRSGGCQCCCTCCSRCGICYCNCCGGWRCWGWNCCCCCNCCGYFVGALFIWAVLCIILLILFNLITFRDLYTCG
eukprot:243797_1